MNPQEEKKKSLKCKSEVVEMWLQLGFLSSKYGIRAARLVLYFENTNQSWS